MARLLLNWKNTNKVFNCAYGAYNLIMRYHIMFISSTLKFLFVFGVNEFGLFFFLTFENFQFFYFGCGCMTFNFTTKMTLRNLLRPCQWMKNLSAKTTRSIQKRNETRLVSISSESQKIHLLIKIFYIYGPNLSKNSLVTISCCLLRTLLSLAVQLFKGFKGLNKHNVFILSFHCFMLLLVFVTFKYSSFRRII